MSAYFSKNFELDFNFWPQFDPPTPEWRKFLWALGIVVLLVLFVLASS